MKCDNSHIHGWKRATVEFFYYDTAGSIDTAGGNYQNLCADCARDAWEEGWGLTEEGPYSIAREEKRAMRRQYINDFRHMKRFDPRRFDALKLPLPIRDAVRMWEIRNLDMTLSLYV